MNRVFANRGSQRCFIAASLLIGSFVAGGACSNHPKLQGDGAGGAGNGLGGANGDGGRGIDLGAGGSTGTGGDPGFTECGREMDCRDGAHCKYGLCLPQLGTCTENGDCPGDSYCDDDDICVPYGVPSGVINDPSCKRGDVPPGVQPEPQCTWDGSQDPNPGFTNIYTTPIIADLNLDDDPNKLQPSVIVTTWATVGSERIGILRVIDGRTCSQQLSIGSANNLNDPDRPAYGTQLAVGDLDGDVTTGGHPEIVGLHRVPGPSFGSSSVRVQPIAWHIVESGGIKTLETKWRGRICGGANDGRAIAFGRWGLLSAPNLWDLNDDGKPEVVIDKFVFDSEGCILNESVRTASSANVQAAIDNLHTVYLERSPPPSETGVITTVADVDLDGKPELVRFDGIYGWTGSEWTLESYANNWPNKKEGHVAVADMGHYSSLPGKPATAALPEIIVVSANPSGNHAWNTNSTGEVRVMKLDGTVVYERFIPHTGCSGSNVECFGGHGGPPTASDFDGDGQVEFAAAANVFYTVYDPDCLASGVPSERPMGTCNRNGNPLPPESPPDGLDHRNGILWAVPSEDFSSSQTGSSIFDFDGDGRAEAVYRDENNLFVFDGRNGAVLFRADANSGTGAEYPTIADVDGDFATEIVYGNDDGLTILKDPEDRWVSSRPLWSQHAYSITHIRDDARVYKTSDWLNNWEVDGLNNFRQNTQGELGALALADLTVELQDIAALCGGGGGSIELAARVCNRGTNPVQDGAFVQFLSKPKDAAAEADGMPLCDAATEILLGVGDCTTVSCSASVTRGHDVFVMVDPEGTIADCHPGNNNGAGSAALCPAVPR